MVKSWNTKKKIGTVWILSKGGSLLSTDQPGRFLVAKIKLPQSKTVFVVPKELLHADQYVPVEEDRKVVNRQRKFLKSVSKEADVEIKETEAKDVTSLSQEPENKTQNAEPAPSV
jgi:hypothetical protein